MRRSAVLYVACELFDCCELANASQQKNLLLRNVSPDRLASDRPLRRIGKRSRRDRSFAIPILSQELRLGLADLSALAWRGPADPPLLHAIQSLVLASPVDLAIPRRH